MYDFRYRTGLLDKATFLKNWDLIFINILLLDECPFQAPYISLNVTECLFCPMKCAEDWPLLLKSGV